MHHLPNTLDIVLLHHLPNTLDIVFRFQTLTREDADATLTYEPDATLTYEPGSTVELEDSEVATNLAGGKRKLAEEVVAVMLA